MPLSPPATSLLAALLVQVHSHAGAEQYPEYESEFDLALHTGTRRGEQYRLRWQDVDLKRGLLTIPRSKHGELRHIQLDSVARAALLKLRQHGDGVGYVCPGLEGPRCRDWRRWFEEVVKKAKIHTNGWKLLFGTLIGGDALA